jgi:polyhydroxyalkanoate synthesis regulator phasin
MSTVTLEDVVQSLREGNANQEDTKKSVDDLSKLFKDYFKSEKSKAGDLLEASRESRRSTGGSAVASAIQQNKEDTSSLGLPMLTPIALALGTWITDFDAYLRALRPDVLLRPIVTFFDSLSSGFSNLIRFADELKNIRLPDIQLSLPRIQFIDDAGKIISDLIDYKIRLPVMEFVDEAGKIISGFKITVPPSVMSFLDGIKSYFSSIEALGTGLIDDIKIPEGATNAINRVSTFFGSIAEWFKSVEFSLDLKPFLDPIKAAFGVAEDGTGFLGFFSKLNDWFGFITKPIGFVTRILGGPLIQGFLSLLDFFSGFAEAFKLQTDEFGNVIDDREFSERLLAGLEGGVVGVIEGIVNAIDLLFLDLPGWILEKLGFENVGKYLKELNIGEMVEPVWNWIKSIPSMIMDLIPSAEELKKFTLETIASLPGGYWILKAIGAVGPELEAARKRSEIEEKQAEILRNESDIERSLSGENVFYGGEEGGRERATARIEELRKEMEQLQKETATGAASNNVVFGSTYNGGSTNVQNNQIGAGDGLSSMDVQFIEAMP